MGSSSGAAERERRRSARKPERERQRLQRSDLTPEAAAGPGGRRNQLHACARRPRLAPAEVLGKQGHPASRSIGAGGNHSAAARLKKCPGKTTALRQLGTIEQIDGTGPLAIRLDSGRSARVSGRTPRHLDHGKA